MFGILMRSIWHKSKGVKKIMLPVDCFKCKRRFEFVTSVREDMKLQEWRGGIYYTCPYCAWEAFLDESDILRSLGVRGTVDSNGIRYTIQDE